MSSCDADIETLLQQILNTSPAAAALGKDAVCAILLYHTRDLGCALEYIPEWYEGWEAFECVDDAADAKGIDRNGIWQAFHAKAKQEFGDDVDLDCVDGDADEQITEELYRAFCVLQLQDDTILVKSRMAGNLPATTLYDAVLEHSGDGRDSLHGDLPKLLKLGPDDILLFIRGAWACGMKKDGCEPSSSNMLACTRWQQYDAYVKRAGGSWEYLCTPYCSEQGTPVHLPADKLQEILEDLEIGHDGEYISLVSGTGEIVYSHWSIMF